MGFLKNLIGKAFNRSRNPSQNYQILQDNTDVKNLLDKLSSNEYPVNFIEQNNPNFDIRHVKNPDEIVQKVKDILTKSKVSLSTLKSDTEIKALTGQGYLKLAMYLTQKFAKFEQNTHFFSSPGTSSVESFKDPDAIVETIGNYADKGLTLLKEAGETETQLHDIQLKINGIKQFLDGEKPGAYLTLAKKEYRTFTKTEFHPSTAFHKYTTINEYIAKSGKQLDALEPDNGKSAEQKTGAFGK